MYFTLAGVTSLAKCATLRVLDLAIYADDAGDVTRESVEQVFKDKKDVTVMVNVS
jgi:hypothetical protein